MRHPELDKHDILAWDFDGTLRDGPNSEFFLEYIAAHPEKTHHIITFRNRSWADEITEELESFDFDMSQIETIESCPDEYHNCYMANVRGDFARRVMMESLGEDQAAKFFENAEMFTMWKGQRASELGCTILVDDIPRYVIPGCDKHDVVFLNANSLIQR